MIPRSATYVLMAFLLLSGFRMADAMQQVSPEEVHDLYEQMCAEVEIHPPINGELVSPEIGEPLQRIMEIEQDWQTAWGWPTAADVIEACQDFRHQQIQT